VKQSVEIIDFICDYLEHHPGPITYQPMLAVVLNQLKNAKGEGIGRHEAPRGEVFHYCRLDGEEYPQAWKVKAPTYNNYATWPPMLMGNTIADLPVILASIDPCLGCADRYVLVHRDRGKKDVLTAEEMRRLSRKKTKEIRRRLKTVGAPVSASDLGVSNNEVIEALVLAAKIRPERHTILGEKGLTWEAAEKLAVKTGVIER